MLKAHFKVDIVPSEYVFNTTHLELFNMGEIRSFRHKIYQRSATDNLGKTSFQTGLFLAENSTFF